MGTILSGNVILCLTSEQRSNYETWLNQVVSRYETLLEGKDRSFSKFILDLPDIPSDIFTLLRELCIDMER